MRKRGIKYLRRLVEVYCLFTRWDAVTVIEDGGFIHIVWITPKMITAGDRRYMDVITTSRTFPKKDIPKRIASYREKIRREFKNRNNA